MKDDNYIKYSMSHVPLNFLIVTLKKQKEIDEIILNMFQLTQQSKSINLTCNQYKIINEIYSV